MPGYRQEVFNVLLAQLLQKRGVISAPENIVKADAAKRMPDVIVNFNGLRTAIEGEVGDHADAPQLALKSARGRVEEGIAHIGIAVVYPEHLRQSDFATLADELAQSALAIAIVTEAGETGFTSGDVDALENALRYAFEQLLKEDVVARAVAILDDGIDHFARAVIDKDGVMDRMAEALEIRGLPERHRNAEDDEE
ncbi:MAG: hypothetical protein FJ009_09855 [Chloroflexi bacterium]|nr:hypothetical protein [Chloroflexota bacterium]